MAAAARSCRTWRQAALEPSRSRPSRGGPHRRNGRAVKKLLQRQFFGRTDNGPGISRVMVEAFNIVQDRIARSRLAGDPPDIVISPRLPAFGLFDFHRAEALIECGVAAAKREIDDIKREIATRRGQRGCTRTWRERRSAVDYRRLQALPMRGDSDVPHLSCA